MNTASITVAVHYNEFEVSAAIAVPVSSAFERCFQKAAVCDDPFIAFATMEDTQAMAEPKYKLRQDAAKILGDQISQELLKIMAKHDTLNRYPIETPEVSDG